MTECCAWSFFVFLFLSCRSLCVSKILFNYWFHSIVCHSFCIPSGILNIFCRRYAVIFQRFVAHQRSCFYYLLLNEYIITHKPLLFFFSNKWKNNKNISISLISFYHFWWLRIWFCVFFFFLDLRRPKIRRNCNIN